MGFKIGVGKKVGPFRAGISNRGAGIGAGPFSAGVSTRRRGGKQQKLGALAVIVIFVLAVVAIAWPYMLGTYIATAVFGAARTSTLRSVFGWVPEVLWLAGVVSAFVMAVVAKVSAKQNQS